MVVDQAHEEEEEIPQASQTLTDNYYFTEVEKKGKEKRNKKEKPSAIFKNETRKRVYERLDASTVPGPGTYLKEKPKEKKEKKGKKRFSPSKEIDEKHLKDVITKILVEVPEE